MENKRTKFDKNEIIINKDFAEVILYNHKNDEIAKTIIDIEDIDKVEKYKWYLSGGYARNAVFAIRLHNLILNFTVCDNQTIDHINRDRLDNRKSNLRIVNYSENAINKGKQSNNTSGYVGVSFDKNRDKYAPHIKINRKKIFLGRYKTIEEAIAVRIEAEIIYFGHKIDRENDKNTHFKKKSIKT